MIKQRTAIASLVLSASALIGIVLNEGYESTAKPPVPGDLNTLGFGSTTNLDGSLIKAGTTTTPTKALVRAMADISKFEGALKKCIKVPLSNNEYSAYTDLAYNIGTGAFCNSTLVSKLNQYDYVGACLEILKWNKFQGKELRGLTIRRQLNYKNCMSETEYALN